MHNIETWKIETKKEVTFVKPVDQCLEI